MLSDEEIFYDNTRKETEPLFHICIRISDDKLGGVCVCIFSRSFYEDTGTLTAASDNGRIAHLKWKFSSHALNIWRRNYIKLTLQMNLYRVKIVELFLLPFTRFPYYTKEQKLL